MGEGVEGKERMGGLVGRSSKMPEAMACWGVGGWCRRRVEEGVAGVEVRCAVTAAEFGGEFGGGIDVVGVGSRGGRRRDLAVGEVLEGLRR